YLLGVESEGGRNGRVGLDAKDSDLDYGIIVVKAGVEPPELITLISDELVSTKVIEQALAQIVSDYEQDGFSRQKSAVIDFLIRSHPRIKGHSGGDLITADNPEARLSQVIDIVK